MKKKHYSKLVYCWVISIFDITCCFSQGDNNNNSKNKASLKNSLQHRGPPTKNFGKYFKDHRPLDFQPKHSFGIWKTTKYQWNQGTRAVTLKVILNSLLFKKKKEKNRNCFLGVFSITKDVEQIFVTFWNFRFPGSDDSDRSKMRMRSNISARLKNKNEFFWQNFTT